MKEVWTPGTDARCGKAKTNKTRQRAGGIGLGVEGTGLEAGAKGQTCMMMRRREPCKVVRTMGAACLHMLFSPFTSRVPPRSTSSSRSYPRPAYLRPTPYRCQACSLSNSARRMKVCKEEAWSHQLMSCIRFAKLCLLSNLYLKTEGFSVPQHKAAHPHHFKQGYAVGSMNEDTPCPHPCTATQTHYFSGLTAPPDGAYGAMLGAADCIAKIVHRDCR